VEAGSSRATARSYSADEEESTQWPEDPLRDRAETQHPSRSLHALSEVWRGWDVLTDLFLHVVLRGRASSTDEGVAMEAVMEDHNRKLQRWSGCWQNIFRTLN
jgi:hypothetical protein